MLTTSSHVVAFLSSGLGVSKPINNNKVTNMILFRIQTFPPTEKLRSSRSESMSSSIRMSCVMRCTMTVSVRVYACIRYLHILGMDKVHRLATSFLPYKEVSMRCCDQKINKERKKLTEIYNKPRCGILPLAQSAHSSREIGIHGMPSIHEHMIIKALPSLAICLVDSAVARITSSNSAEGL